MRRIAARSKSDPGILAQESDAHSTRRHSGPSPLHKAVPCRCQTFVVQYFLVDSYGFSTESAESLVAQRERIVFMKKNAKIVDGPRPLVVADGIAMVLSVLVGGGVFGLRRDWYNRAGSHEHVFSRVRSSERTSFRFGLPAAGLKVENGRSSSASSRTSPSG